MKLNLGDAGKEYDGYTGVDISRGQDARQLPYSDVDEIRASHILEHLPSAEIAAVLKEWVRALRPGGVLKIAVPNFQTLAEQYLAGANLNVQGYVMGGQTDAHDFHKVLFDREILSDSMKAAGLIGIRHWEDEIEDCSRLPISLNLCGTKPYAVWPKCHAVISMPRLGFNDFWDCAVTYLKYFMPVRRTSGAYWDWNLEQAIDEAILETDPEWILTADYDSIFMADQIMALLDLAARHPEADAIAPLQSSRSHNSPMFTIMKDGKPQKEIAREEITRRELIETRSAHFGLTLLRVSKLKLLPKPWFYRTWGEAQADPDVNFWDLWRKNGNTLFTALRVPIGHCELMVRWPDINLEATMQRPSEFFKTGAPENVWR